MIASNLAISAKIVGPRRDVLDALAIILAIFSVVFRQNVLIVKESIAHQITSVQYISNTMKLLQSNIQSINTSKSLVNFSILKNEIDVVLLQEVWTPYEEIRFKDFQKPIQKLRSKNTYGGVAIAAHKRAKIVHCPEYDVDGLEAIWADVKIENIRTIVGSVYINVGKVEELTFARQGHRKNSEDT